MSETLPLLLLWDLIRRTAANLPFAFAPNPFTYLLPCVLALGG
jgi:hypothetical protein